MKVKYPTTKFNDVWDYYNSLNGEINVCYARNLAGFKEEVVFSLLKIRTAKIKEKYSKLLDLEDLYFFENLEGLEKFLVQTKWFSVKRIKSDMQHEEEHAIKIKQLGYQNSGFDCWLVLDDKQKIDYIASCKMVVEKLPLREEYLEIALAPKNPSYFDKNH
jgi:hypothetical protein